MSPTNWPDPKCPGVPLFSEKTLRHVLKKKDTGEIIIRNWKSDGKHWDMIGHSAQWCSETYFYEGPVLTATQINEMLAAERQWCADACRAMSFDSHYTKTQRDALEEAENAIRNLGAAP